MTAPRGPKTPGAPLTQPHLPRNPSSAVPRTPRKSDSPSDRYPRDTRHGRRPGGPHETAVKNRFLFVFRYCFATVPQARISWGRRRRMRNLSRTINRIATTRGARHKSRARNQKSLCQKSRKFLFCPPKCECSFWTSNSRESLTTKRVTVVCSEVSSDIKLNHRNIRQRDAKCHENQPPRLVIFKGDY